MDFDDIKSTIFTVVLIALVGLGGYWAFSTMESGSSHLDNQKVSGLESEIESLKEENKDLKEEVARLKEDISKAEAEKEEANAEKEVVENTSNETTTKPATTTKTYKYQSLIDELQKLVDANVYMKKGSTGTRVGTIQKFLNIYNGTSNRVDNDYGNSTVTAVKNFQSKVGLTADGQTGPNTYKKMIAWLKTK